jgi:hypothetical protein
LLGCNRKAHTAQNQYGLHHLHKVVFKFNHRLSVCYAFPRIASLFVVC